MRLLFAELDRYWWPRTFITGPNQDGKTLSLMIILAYLLFELRETVIWGVPSLDMVADKWNLNLLPLIKNSRYAEGLPRRGAGSRDGTSVLVQFRNGAPLRFMTAGGDDQSRAGFTSQNLVVTETDGFDEVGGKSREGDKLSQLEKRTLAFGSRARVIAECTVGLETGRTWQEYEHGTQARIVLRCHACHQWVTPEREHLCGWQDAESEIEAAQKTAIACPSCGVVWTNEQRVSANLTAKLLHSGQSIGEDKVCGEPPLTRTFGYRWTCVNSILNRDRLSLVGADEWKARRATDEENADKNLRQKEWVLPIKPQRAEVHSLDPFKIMRRVIPKLHRGFCPAGTEFITVGCDIGKRLSHWVALAWRREATPHILDYGRLEVPSEIMGEEAAILSALRDWREGVLAKGWSRDGAELLPILKFVDCGNWQSTILAFCKEADGFFACKGYGATQKRAGGYKRDTGTKVIESFDHYSLIQLPSGDEMIEVNSDHWKGFLQARIASPMATPGALTLYDGGDHLSICKHLTAERQFEEFVPGAGVVTRFEQVNANNHFGDAAMLATVAGHAAGARLMEEQAPAEQPRDQKSPASAPKSFADSWRGRY